MKKYYSLQSIVKPFIVLFLFFCGTHFVLAEELDMLGKIRKNGEAVVHYTVGNKKHSILLKGMKEYNPKRQYSDEEVAAMREVLKRKLKYKIDGRFYTMTDDDWKLVSSRKVINYYIRLVLYPDTYILKPHLFPLKEHKDKNLTRFHPLEIDNYKKGQTVSLIPKSVIEKTNNLSLYLANYTTVGGKVEIMGLNSGIRIYRLRANKEYSKKVDIIEDYYSIISPLATLEMTEIKERFALSSIGISFGLVLKKDFSEEIAEFYFYRRNDYDFIVIDYKKRKFYRLKDKDRLLLKIFGEILEKK